MDCFSSRLAWTSRSFWILTIGLAIVMAACAESTKPVQPSQNEVIITSTLVKPGSESSPAPLDPVPSSTTHQTATLTPEPVKSPADRMISRLGRHWSTKMVGLMNGSSIAIGYGNELCLYPLPIIKAEWCILVDRSPMGFLWTLTPQPQGKILAVGLANGKIRLVDPGTGEVLRTITAASDNVRSLAWSPDGTLLASGSDDLRVKVWEASSGQLTGGMAADQSSVVSLAWSPDGSKVAGGTFIGKVILWDAHTFEQLAEWKGGTGYAVASLTWTKDSKYIYAGTNFSPGCGEGCNPILDGRAVRLDGSSLQVLNEWTAEKPVLALALSPGEQELSVETADGVVWLLVGNLNQVIDQTTGGGNASGFVWTGQSELIFLSNEPRPYDLPNSVDFPALIGPGKWVQWNPRTGLRVETSLPIDPPVSGPAWSPDSTLLSVGTPSGDLLLWNRQTGAVHKALHLDHGFSSLAWSPDGTQAAVMATSNQPVLVDTHSFQVIKKLDEIETDIASLYWSPGGKWLAGANWEQVVVWDSLTGKVIFRTDTTSYQAVAWSPDGDHLAVSGGDEASLIMIWDVESGMVEKELYSQGWITSLAWSGGSSSDGRIAVAAGGWAEVWDVKQEKLLYKKPSDEIGHSWGIDIVGLSPDGSILATAAADIILWDLDRGVLYGRLEGHTETVNNLCFSPDGKRLASGSREGVVIIWDIGP